MAPGKVGRARLRAARDQERLQEVIQNAWLLSPEEVARIVPGDEGRLSALMKGPFQNPLEPVNEQQRDNPAHHLLGLMRDPDRFAFTCEKVFNTTLLPMQAVILRELWARKFPMLIGSRGLGKSFLLALYLMLRALFRQGTKIVIVGAAFRQAKVVFEYVEFLWSNAPVLRDICGGVKGRNNREQGPRRDIDRCECIIGDSVIIALPLGDGKKIRGQRANVIVAEEFASIRPDIYETVIAGFASVSQDPVLNVQDEARNEVMRRLGLWNEDLEADALASDRGNQSIISGTAFYSFNWFCKYWERYRSTILSRGDPEKLKALSPSGVADPDINHRDYAVIRVPVELIPRGFMDKKHVGRARMTVSSGIFAMEYGAVFTSDSDGFFKMSLIESCTAGSPNSPVPFRFTAALKGEPKVQHVIGVDPASQRDNFAVVVLALCDDHRRVVHCWTVRKKQFQARLKEGLTQEQEFYGFVARRIRDLMKAFPCVRLVMDAQGGGRAVQEALCDPAKLKPGEVPVWEVIDPDPKKRKDSDGKKGLHVLELVEFADAKWVGEANHGLKKDMEDKELLFPYLDSALVGLAVEEDKEEGRLVDTYDDAVVEVEELKRELATIEHGDTETGRERWDTPKVKSEGHRPGRLMKDRYSALLMANMAARRMARATPSPQTQAEGGWARELAARKVKGGPMYALGEGWGEASYDDDLGASVVR